MTKFDIMIPILYVMLYFFWGLFIMHLFVLVMKVIEMINDWRSK